MHGTLIFLGYDLLGLWISNCLFPIKEETIMALVDLHLNFFNMNSFERKALLKFLSTYNMIKQQAPIICEQ